MARCFFYHRNYRAATLASLRQWKRSVGGWRVSVSLARGMAAELGWIAGKLRALALQRLALQRVAVLSGLSDTQEANAALTAWLAASPVSQPAWSVPPPPP